MTKPKYARSTKPERGTNFRGYYGEGDYIPSLECSYGEACNRLRKSWIKLKIANKSGDEEKIEEARETINYLQETLGIKVTIWKEDYDREIEDFE